MILLTQRGSRESRGRGQFGSSQLDIGGGQHRRPQVESCRCKITASRCKVHRGLVERNVSGCNKGENPALLQLSETEAVSVLFYSRQRRHAEIHTDGWCAAKWQLSVSQQQQPQCGIKPSTGSVFQLAAAVSDSLQAQ